VLTGSCPVQGAWAYESRLPLPALLFTAIARLAAKTHGSAFSSISNVPRGQVSVDTGQRTIVQL